MILHPKQTKVNCTYFKGTEDFEEVFVLFAWD